MLRQYRNRFRVDPFGSSARGFLVARANPLPTLLVDDQARIRFLNPAAKACFRWSPEEAFLQPLEWALPVRPTSLGIGDEEGCTGTEVGNLRAQDRNGHPFLVHLLCIRLDKIFLLLLRPKEEVGGRHRLNIGEQGPLNLRNQGHL